MLLSLFPWNKPWASSIPGNSPRISNLLGCVFSLNTDHAHLSYTCSYPRGQKVEESREDGCRKDTREDMGNQNTYLLYIANAGCHDTGTQARYYQAAKCDEDTLPNLHQQLSPLLRVPLSWPFKLQKASWHFWETCCHHKSVADSWAITTASCRNIIT